MYVHIYIYIYIYTCMHACICIVKHTSYVHSLVYQCSDETVDNIKTSYVS